MIAPGDGFAVVDALGSTLLHFLWQGAAVGLLYWLLRPSCTSANARYRLGLSTLGVLVLCPLLTLVWLWPGAGAPATATGLDSVAAVAARQFTPWHGHAALPWLVASWLCGVFAIAARSLWQWRNLQAVVRGASRPDAGWELRLARLRARFGIDRPVRLLVSARVLTPMLVGWIKPAIVLPLSLLSGFTPQQVELIIAHELGHIRRWDYLANVAQVVIETLLFYHPVVHAISRDVRNAREECCDDLVLQVASGDALAYARALAGLEELRLDSGFAAPALAAGGGELLTRIRRIVGVAATTQPAPRLSALPLVLAAAALLFGAWRMQQRQADLAEVLDALPAQALALVSGNPQLVAAPRLSVALPAPELAPLARLAIAAPDDGVRIVPVPASFTATQRPRVSDFVPEHVRLSDVAPEVSAAGLAADAQAAPLQVVAPVYPPRAMVDGVQGRVELSYRIGADGSVGQVRVLHAQPAGVFEDAARSAIGAWRFPASAAGQVRTQNFAFSLRGRVTADDKCQSPTGTLICRHPGD